MSPPGRARLHVLQVVGNAIVGGMEQWVERLVEGLPPERYAFSALCPYEGGFTERLRALGVEVLVAPMPDDPPWTTIQNTAALVKQLGVDLLHAHLPRAHLLAGLVGRLTGTPVLTTIHGRQLTSVDIEVQRLADSHVSVVCRQSYLHALGLGIDPARLSCDCNGVDTERFRPRARPRLPPPDGAAPDLRAEFGLDPDTPLIGFVGRLSPEKGPEVLVRAMLLVRLQRPEAHAVFIGGGPMAAELQALAAEWGVQSHVHFAGVRGAMHEVYGELDILVSCSHSEAMPLAVMEGMACGLPVVATQVGGLTELVEHGLGGWLVGPGDFHDIAQRCTALLAEPALRERMGARSRARAVSQLDLAASLGRVDRLLTRLARPGAALLNPAAPVRASNHASNNTHAATPLRPAAPRTRAHGGGGG